MLLGGKIGCASFTCRQIVACHGHCSQHIELTVVMVLFFVLTRLHCDVADALKPC